MIYAGVKLDGGRALRATMRKAGSDMQDMKQAHAGAANIVEGRARGWAPVRTGKLAATVRSSGTKTAAIVRAGKKRVPYANVIHWGWQDKNIKPNPFLSYSAQATEPTWIKLYESVVNKALDKIHGV